MINEYPYISLELYTKWAEYNYTSLVVYGIVAPILVFVLLYFKRNSKDMFPILIFFCPVILIGLGLVALSIPNMLVPEVPAVIKILRDIKQ